MILVLWIILWILFSGPCPNISSYLEWAGVTRLILPANDQRSKNCRCSRSREGLQRLTFPFPFVHHQPRALEPPRKRWPPADDTRRLSGTHLPRAYKRAREELLVKSKRKPAKEKSLTVETRTRGLERQVLRAKNNYFCHVTWISYLASFNPIHFVLFFSWFLWVSLGSMNLCYLDQMPWDPIVISGD